MTFSIKITLSIMGSIVLLGIIYLGTVGFNPTPQLVRQNITVSVQGS